ncbi:hypothetical protein SLS59_002824 [Nothophoma quercina]|uniref:Uncharacterized protein n=1 Tax=Nothophoma quercina TaxID=749835 RepID=A0ABR3RRR5_9PLEO
MTTDTISNFLNGLLDLQNQDSQVQALEHVIEALRNLEGADLDRLFACLWAAPCTDRARESVVIITMGYLRDSGFSFASLDTKNCTQQDLDAWVGTAYANLIDTNTIRTLVGSLLVEAATKISRSLLQQLLSITAPGYDDEENPVGVEVELWRLVTARDMARRARRIDARMDRLDGCATTEQKGEDNERRERWRVAVREQGQEAACQESAEDGQED